MVSCGRPQLFQSCITSAAGSAGFAGRSRVFSLVYESAVFDISLVYESAVFYTAPAEVCRASFCGRTTNWVKFSPADDLAMLSYVRNANPFRDQREWTHIATKTKRITNQPFTRRTVRDNTYLLLGRFIAKDRVAPRR